MFKKFSLLVTSCCYMLMMFSSLAMEQDDKPKSTVTNTYKHGNMHVRFTKYYDYDIEDSTDPSTEDNAPLLLNEARSQINYYVDKNIKKTVSFPADTDNSAEILNDPNAKFIYMIFEYSNYKPIKTNKKFTQLMREDYKLYGKFSSFTEFFSDYGHESILMTNPSTRALSQVNHRFFQVYTTYLADFTKNNITKFLANPTISGQKLVEYFDLKKINLAEYKLFTRFISKFIAASQSSTVIPRETENLEIFNYADHLFNGLFFSVEENLSTMSPATLEFDTSNFNRKGDHIHHIMQYGVSGGLFLCIPRNIYLAKNLKVLKLNSNKISSLPPELFYLTQLEHLNISDNLIGNKLSSAVGNLKELTYLNISRNFISKIPKEIAELSKLEHLFLAINRLKKLPIEMTVILPKLKFFNHFDNKLDMTDSDTAQIIKTYEDLKVTDIANLTLLSDK